MSPQAPTRRPLTRIAQAAVGAALGDGARAIDATMGNGHDTLFLARAVGPQGRVIAFDVQDAALAATDRRLRAAGVRDRAELLQRGHEDLDSAVPDAWRGRVDAVMFNLGYLPGSDKARVTGPATTRPALDQARRLLRTGGVLSVLLYRGHPGAAAEVDAVLHWLDDCPAGWSLESQRSPGPWLFLLRRDRA
jgi:ubiquinone/menaquinone biosynthesis C-methylase UbiE